MKDGLVARATAAACSIAEGLGLQVNEAVVIQNSNTLALRLLPCDTFARTALIGQEVAALEVQVAKSLAAVTAPIASLDPRVEPRVYERDGFAVTFWSYYGPATDLGSPGEYADALYRLHAAMRSIEIKAPHFTERIAAAERLLTDQHETPALADNDRHLLLDTLHAVREAIHGHMDPEPTPARRAASREPPGHPRRPALHRLRDMLPWPHRVRRCSRAGRGQRALSGYRPGSAPRVSSARPRDGRGLALGRAG